MFEPLSTTAPDWFRKAISCEPESRFVAIDGARTHYLSWNAQDAHKPALLFGHGFRAHARWWSFIAPFFTSRFRVYSLDFAGMGDSDYRPAYSAATFCDDILGVIGHGKLGRTTLVGHSFGARCMLRTLVNHPEQVARSVVIDSDLQVPGFERRLGPRRLEARAKRVYSTRDAARERFRLIPEPGHPTPYIMDYVAWHSMKAVDGGWIWKFDEKLDPLLIEGAAEPDVETLARVTLPVTFIYGDLSSLVSRGAAHAIVKRIQNGRGPIAIPQSNHHVMLDQPLPLIAALKAVLY